MRLFFHAAFACILVSTLCVLSASQANAAKKMTGTRAAMSVHQTLPEQTNPETAQVAPNNAPRPPRPIVLGPEDVPAFPAAPLGFDQKRAGVPQGALTMVQYHSASVGTDRHMLVYTPPGYSPAHRYPVLYLLHGIGGDENEWKNNGAPDIILDNLLADKKIVPMIVVFPNGRAKTDDRSQGNIYSTDNIQAFADFDNDLLGSILPYVQSHYSVRDGAKYCALAGLSMGGGQALNIGLSQYTPS
jgi:enterochelin esterase-like enzyme